MNPLYKRLQKKLDEQFSWPTIYMFKFIAPIEKINEVLNLFSKADTETKVSSKGNYVSVTFTPLMLNSDKVIEKYREAEKIKGIVAL